MLQAESIGVPFNGKAAENQSNKNGNVNKNQTEESNVAAEPDIKFPPPDIWPEKNLKSKKKKSKLGSIINIQVLCSSIKKVSY